jgi:hypothetical protein
MNLDVFQKNKKININITNVEKPFVCAHCGKGYTKESTLSVHMCEQKRRYLAKDEKHVLLGFQTYQRFFEISQKSKMPKTYDEFAKSQYYNAFVKFGSFISNVNPLYPDRYIDYIVTSGIKLDRWCREEHYYAYVLDLIKKEPAEVALQRTIGTMTDWAEENGSQWNHYFKYVNRNRAVYHIKDGKISPWLVLNCRTGKEMLSELTEEQLTLVAATIDIDYWKKRFKLYLADMELLNQIVERGNL